MKQAAEVIDWIDDDEDDAPIDHAIEQWENAIELGSGMMASWS